MAYNKQYMRCLFYTSLFVVVYLFWKALVEDDTTTTRQLSEPKPCFLASSISSRSWRLWTNPSETVNGDMWDVSYIQFFPSEDCSGLAYPNHNGVPIHSSSHYNIVVFGPQNAFTSAEFWGGEPKNNEFYIGMTFRTSYNVRCVKVDQRVEENMANKVWVQAFNEDKGIWENIYVGTELTVKGNVINTVISSNVPSKFSKSLVEDDVATRRHLTAKEDVSQILISQQSLQKKNSDTLSTPSTTLDIFEKRELNNDSPLCKKFKFNGTPHQFNGRYVGTFTGPLNYSTDDENEGKITLRAWCDSLGADKKCCAGNTDSLYEEQECSGWSDKPNTTYEVCENSCINTRACWGIAKHSLDGSYIKLSKGSCSDTSLTDSGDGYSCIEISSDIWQKLNINIGEDSCTNHRSCEFMAGRAISFENLSVGSNSCTNERSCSTIAYSAEKLKDLSVGSNSCIGYWSCKGAAHSAISKQVVINYDQCNSSEICYNCGRHSTFNDALTLTEQCCAETSNESVNNFFDTACNANPSAPSQSPTKTVSPSSASQQPSTNSPMKAPRPCFLASSISSRSWRLWTNPSETVNGDIWDVSYIQFFPSEDCSGLAFPNNGVPIHSNSYNLGDWGPQNAFNAGDQAWGGRHDHKNEFYIGMTFRPTYNVRCVKVDQRVEENMAKKVWVQAFNEDKGIWKNIYVGTELTVKGNVINTVISSNAPSLVSRKCPSASPSTTSLYPSSVPTLSSLPSLSSVPSKIPSKSFIPSTFPSSVQSDLSPPSKYSSPPCTNSGIFVVGASKMIIFSIMIVSVGLAVIY